VPHLPKPIADPQSCDYESATVAVASSPDLAPKSKNGEEAATPGQPVALCAFLVVSPGDPLS
jgi:hypothetical protein